MSGIFISYRRSDTSGYAGRLYDRLSSHFGARQVFIDIDHIDPGDDFARTIDSRIHQADVVLVLIGPSWLQAADAEGRPRLHSTGDYVRLEIATALRHDKKVIPVLLGGAAMPNDDALPPELRPLATRHAFSCSDERFHADVDTLIEKTDGRWRWRTKARSSDKQGRAKAGIIGRWTKRTAALALLGGIVVLVMQFGVLLTPGNDGSSRPYTPPPVRKSPERSSYGNRSNAPHASLDSLRDRPKVGWSQHQDVVRRYNRTAKQIIDSMGR